MIETEQIVSYYVGEIHVFTTHETKSRTHQKSRPIDKEKRRKLHKIKSNIDQN